MPGLSTGGFVCALLQLVYNEVQVARVKYVSKHLTDSQVVHAPTPQDARPVAPPPLPREPQKPLSERILTTLGFQRLPDDTYLEKLKRSRDEHLRRITELEREVEAERHSKESSSS